MRFKTTSAMLYYAYLSIVLVRRMCMRISVGILTLSRFNLQTHFRRKRSRRLVNVGEKVELSQNDQCLLLP